MSEWTAVADAMPKVDKPVLVSCRDVIGTSVWVATWIGHGWRTMPGRWNLDSVTHWGPLPQPPTEEP